ncbi:MAG: glycoside hydrolase family 31 protein [Armatimonadetes bacterium]|nr:glycoside hydrolase family 31 protein [Armatimonadota bacterium]
MRLDPGALRRLDTLWLRDTTPSGARFTTEAGTLQAEIYAPGILRLRLSTGPEIERPDYGLLAANPEPPSRIGFSEDAGVYRLEAGGMAGEDGAEPGSISLELRANPLRLRLMRRGVTLLESSGDAHIRGGLRLPAVAVESGDGGEPGWFLNLGLRSGEPVYGLGEKFGPLDHRGQLITSWNEDALGVNSERSYKNIPFAWSPQGWALFVHTTGRVTHGVGYPQWSQRSYVLRVDDPTLDLFLFAADSPAALLERFTHLTGRAPLPPRWSYGVWMSRCYYRTPDEALDVARTLRERRIPCDVLVLDGRAWLEVETRYGFEWDAERYPDPNAFIGRLKALGFRLCLWEYPYVSVHNPLFARLAEKGYLLRRASGEPYIYEWDPEPFGMLLAPLPHSGMVDFTHPEAFAWFRDAHKDLFEQGVDVFKTDFGEQVPEDAVAANGEAGRRLHNVYPLLFNRCAYEASQRYAPGGALVWGRSGWTGSQRYPIQWGGDPQADWEGLAASVRGGLSWGMSGAPFHSHDIGGFYHQRPGALPDPELYVRWMQAGVMASHTRFHGTSPREPWFYGDEAERIVRRWLEWRYRLIPYIEACAQEAQQTGMPVARAMPLAFPEDAAAWAFEHQYMLGPSLLVAPVLSPDGDVTLHLPKGGWYDLSSGERIEGPRTLRRTMPLEEMPVYGREGHSLPLGPAVQHTGELDEAARINEIWIFGAPSQKARADLSGLPKGTRLRHF